MEMDSSRRSFDRSREPGMKKSRLSDEPNLRDPRILNSGVRGIRAPPAGPLPSRYRQIERDAEADDSTGGGYHPTHQLFSELVREYRKGLAELTSNSKPIITNLTIIAGENLHAAKAIAETICCHIIEVPSEQKLPSLYLLDSIVKNIGRDYIKYFSTKLPEVYCKAYGQVDPPIHAGMRHLFQTWGGVFPLQPLQMIEKELGISLAVNGLGSVSARSKQEPQSQYLQKSIHVNPKYLEARQNLQPPNRAKGPTSDISRNIMKSARSVARPNIQHRKPLRESMYEKDTEVLFGDYDFSLKKSGIGERDKHWYGAGTDMEDAVMGQQSGYDAKHKLTNYSPPKLYDNRSNVGLSKSWKNNEEEEYSWDDVNSRVTNHNTPTEPRKVNMAFGDYDDLESTDGMDYPVATTRRSLQSADNARVLGVTSGEASSSLGRKALQSQMTRPSATGALAKPQTNSNSTIGQKRPAPTFRQPTVNQRSPSHSFSAGHDTLALHSPAEVDLPVSHTVQRAVSNSAQISEQDDVRPRSQLKKEVSPMMPQSGKKHLVNSQKSKLIPSLLAPSQQRTQPYSLSQHSRSEGRLSGLSVQNLKQPSTEALTIGNSAIEAAQQLNSSDLLAPVLNSGVLSKQVRNSKSDMDSKVMPEPVHSNSHPPVPGGVARLHAGSKASKMSATPIITSSQDNRSVPSASKTIGPPTLTTACKALSRKIGEEKADAPNQFSDLLSTLMDKGLITSFKNESSTTTLMSDESQDVIPGVIAMSLPTTLAPASSSHLSLFGSDKVTASEHAVNKSTDNSSDASEVKNLIGFEFKPNIIRQLHEPVIQDLFDGLSYKCAICGLRLKTQETIDRHMEWHSSKELYNEYGSSRRWFSNLDDWVAGKLGITVETVGSTEEIKEAAFEDEQYIVPADESQCVCILCGELFEDYYSREEDVWMFCGAMQVKITGSGYENITASGSPARDLIVHAECFSESSARELGLVAKVKVVSVMLRYRSPDSNGYMVPCRL